MKILFIVLTYLLTNHAYTQDDPSTPYNDVQYNLLKKGKKYFIAYQKAYLKNEGEMPKINLTEADLQGYDFRTLNLDGADFSSAILSGAIFGVVDVNKQTNFISRKEIMDDPNLIKPASLKNANFEGSDIGEFEGSITSFCHADCSGANFNSSDLTGCKFIYTNLQGADLSECSLVGSNLRGANLENANLADADIEKCIFERTVIRGANVEGLNWEDAEKTDCIK